MQESGCLHGSAAENSCGGRAHRRLGLGDNRLQVMNLFNNQEKTPFLLPIRSPETKPL
jgi:hypothetical protein